MIDRFAEKAGAIASNICRSARGPRICVGAQFATTEALTILAHLAREWRFADAGHQVRAAGMVTLAPEGRLAAGLSSAR